MKELSRWMSRWGSSSRTILLGKTRLAIVHRRDRARYGCIWRNADLFNLLDGGVEDVRFYTSYTGCRFIKEQFF